jgi:hypothetical protein
MKLDILFSVPIDVAAVVQTVGEIGECSVGSTREFIVHERGHTLQIVLEGPAAPVHACVPKARSILNRPFSGTLIEIGL